MLRRMICVLFALIVLMGVPLRSEATQVGSIRVVLGKDEEVVSSGSVTLYRAGKAISGGYRLSEAFGGGVVAWEDADSPALAWWLAEQAGAGGTTLLLDADGRADFTGLGTGLYLLVQDQAAEGYYPMVPFLVQLPYEGQWDVQAVPKTERLPEELPKTGQDPTPILAGGGMVFSGLGLVLLAGRRKRRV